MLARHVQPHDDDDGMVGGNEQIPALTGPFKAMHRIDNRFGFLFHLKLSVLKHLELLKFPWILEGAESSGGLVRFISTYPGASPTLCCRVMAKNL